MLVKVAPNMAKAAGGLRMQIYSRGLGFEGVWCLTFSEGGDVAGGAPERAVHVRLHAVGDKRHATAAAVPGTWVMAPKVAPPTAVSVTVVP